MLFQYSFFPVINVRAFLLDIQHEMFLLCPWSLYIGQIYGEDPVQTFTLEVITFLILAIVIINNGTKPCTLYASVPR